MGKLMSAYLMPHPPIIVHEVGRGEEHKIQKTIDSFEKASRNIESQKPDTIIIISPHAYVFSDAVSIDMMEKVEGDLGQFGAYNVKMEFQGDLSLASDIVKNAENEKIPVAKIDDKMINRFKLSKKLDHGSIVPLYFIRKYIDGFKLIRMSYGFLPFEKLYDFGVQIGKSIRESDRNVVFIASGDLSHKLTPDSPNGYTPNGKVFDEKLLNLLRDFKVKEIINMDKELISDAAECGFRSVCVMLGVLDGYKVKTNILSYEGPFGVGYGVAEFISESYTGIGLLDELYKIKKERIDNIRKSEDAYVKLARESLEYYLKNNRIMSVPNGLPEEMIKTKAGVFVSLHKDGELRGCIGTIYPSKNNIAEEIIRNAVSAGTEDPRFYPVELDELDDIVYSVDVLTKPEPVKSKDELDAKKYGVIVKSGYKSGLLLPDLDGVDTVDQQISIALRKAGIAPDEKYTLERFQVVRHK
ncbi:MAG: AmmeMemoRadiSam system protein A [Thermoanaerobacterium sp.]|nr:AmmeMemoRadiSam system protein A [Thermoanaerobacterium sp.]